MLQQICLGLGVGVRLYGCSYGKVGVLQQSSLEFKEMLHQSNSIA